MVNTCHFLYSYTDNTVGFAEEKTIHDGNFHLNERVMNVWCRQRLSYFTLTYYNTRLVCHITNLQHYLMYLPFWSTAHCRYNVYSSFTEVCANCYIAIEIVTAKWCVLVNSEALCLTLDCTSESILYYT